MSTDEHGFKHGELTKKIIGAFFAVYNELGYGFLESVYEAALELVLRELGLKVVRQASVAVRFRGRVIGEFRTDLLIEDVVTVEIKAARALDPSHEAQLLNYLRATDIEVGLLFNFGPKPQFKRMVLDNPRKQIRVHLCSSVADIAREEAQT